MEITLVFLTLATLVAAVPTYPHTYQDRDSLSDYVPIIKNREKKSTHHDPISGLSPEVETMDASTHDSLKSKPRITPVEGRNFGHKKPIIIKKKIGYHLYRDSDEEMAHADPHENCRKQVKVKLCDDGSGSSKNMLNCFTSERFNSDVSDQEIENSIKTAKEAVENLQRGLQKMERTSPKMIHNDDLESDFEVHENIEAARLALEHVQQNFGKMEINSHENSPKIKEFHISRSTDEERLVHWKEAINNVQKNFEIARNIEDAFKSDSQHNGLLSIQNNDLQAMRESENSNSNLVLKQKVSTGSEGNIVSNQMEKSAQSNLKEIVSDFEPTLSDDNLDTAKNQDEEVDFDMFTSPTETDELKLKLHSDSLKSDVLPMFEESVHNSHVKSLNDHEMEHTLTGKNSLTQSEKSEQLHDNISETNEKVTCDNVHEHEEKVASDLSLSAVEDNKHENFKKSEKPVLTDRENMQLNMKDKSSSNINEETQHQHDVLLKSNTISDIHGDIEGKKSEMLQDTSTSDIGQTLDESHNLRSTLNKVDKQQKDERLKTQSGSQDIHEFENRETLPSPKDHFDKNNANENILKHTFSSNLNQAKLQESAMKAADDTNNQQGLDEALNMRAAMEKNIKQSSKKIEKQHHDLIEQSNMRMSENDNVIEVLNPNMKMSHEHNDLPSMHVTGNKHHNGFLTLQSNILSELRDDHVTSSKTIDFDNGPHTLNGQLGMQVAHDHGMVNHRLQNSLPMRSAQRINQEDHLLQPIFTELRSDHFNPTKAINPNERHFLNEHTNMRLSQDQNIGHHLTEFNEPHDPLLMHWTHAKKANDNLSQVSRTASGIHAEHMSLNDGHHHDQHILEELGDTTLKQRHDMWPQASENHDFLMRLVQEKQLKDQSQLNPELGNEHLHEFTTHNRFPNNFDLTNMHDFSQSAQDHFNIMKHAHLSDMDSEMHPSMIMNMRESNLDHNDMNWNHHHHSMARYGSNLPVTGVSPGAVGVFPNANTGCGIPLMLSCSPSIVSGSLAKAHPAGITSPAYRAGDDLMFYMKRDAQNINKISPIKVQKTLTQYNHKSDSIFDKSR